VVCSPWTPEFEDCATASKKLALNDASFSFEHGTSAALVSVFRCGFSACCTSSGIRDDRSASIDIDLITTAPSVIYDIHMKDGTVEQLHNPPDMPDLIFFWFPPKK